MRFAIERDALAEAVTWAARGLPARPPVPVLAGVLLEAASDGALTLSAFDYEVSARITVAADIEEAGQALVSGRLLADISRNLPPGQVQVSSDGSKVHVHAATSRFALLTMPVDEYPTLPQMPEASGTVPGNVFTQAVHQVTTAAGRDDTLPILTGVSMRIEGEKVTLLATDRYRLAQRDFGWSPRTPGVDATALIPARTLAETARSLGASADITVSLGGQAGADGLIGFEAGGRRTTSRLLDGEYPKVSSIFPTNIETRAVIDTARFVEAVKRVALVAERNTYLQLTFTQGQLSLEASQGEDAQATEAMEASLQGEDIEVRFNPQYLLDGLSALATRYARLSFTQPTKPAVLHGQAELDGASDESYQYVFMPIRRLVN